MADRIPVRARAIVTSTRPGALSILDAGDALEDDPVARYYAEPVKIAEAMALLEELGFSITTRDRMGVSFSGWQETFESAFAVTLERDTDQDGIEAWHAFTAGTNTPLPVIPPSSDAQKACMRGVLLDVPAEQYVPSPINTLPAVEAKYFSEIGQGVKTRDYWILPHQLRRQLSAEWRSDDELDRIPRGAGVKVIVVDSGWAGQHSYWDDANLRKAADNVKLVQDYLGFSQARQQIVANIELLAKDIPKLVGSLIPHRSTTLRERLTTLSETRRRAILAICNTYAGALDYMRAAMPKTKIGAARTALDAPSSHSELDKKMAAFIESLQKALEQSQTDLGDLPLSPKPENDNNPHGTSVVGQLIAVAPEADVTVVQVIVGGNSAVYSEAFSRHSSYTGWSIPDGLSKAAAMGPRIVSCSLGSAFDYSPWLTPPPAGRDEAVKSYQLQLQALALKGAAAFFCSGNFYKEKHEPPKVVAHSRLEEDNLILVGGAWWDKPGSDENDERVLSASDYAIGYRTTKQSGDTTEVNVPHVCGLVGPAPDPNDEDGFWGMCVSFLWMEGKERIGAGSGTSLATPQLAGIGACVLSRAPWLGPKQLREQLMETSCRLPKGKFAQPHWAENVLDLTKAEGRPGLADLHAAATKASSGFAPIDFVDALGNAKWRTANPKKTKWKSARP